MNEMVERVARALMISDGHHATAEMQWDADDWMFQKFEKYARAAIEAMRELPGEPGPRYSAGEYSRRSQEAMVDDALEKTAPPALSIME
jgi:hypothetical protein